MYAAKRYLGDKVEIVVAQFFRGGHGQRADITDAELATRVITPALSGAATMPCAGKLSAKRDPCHIGEADNRGWDAHVHVRAIAELAAMVLSPATNGTISKPGA